MDSESSIEQRLQRVVCSTLRISPDRYSEDLAAGDIPEWDSIAHVALMMQVEKEFNVAFDVADVIDVESVGDVLDLVARYAPSGGT